MPPIARIDTDNWLTLTALEPADLVLIDVPSCKGWGDAEGLEEIKKRL